jgi:1-aminocyclopropane-1-carboxylate deaminase
LLKLCPMPETYTPLQPILDLPGPLRNLQLFLKRDDLIHPTVIGNKWRKLAPILAQWQREGVEGVLSFGGTHSNHLRALAVAGPLFGLRTAAVIRGMGAQADWPILNELTQRGMTWHAVPKPDFDHWEQSEAVQTVLAHYPTYKVLPLGGATAAGVAGCIAIGTEIITQIGPTPRPLIVAVPAGTGSTAAGIVKGLAGRGDTWIFPAARYGVEVERWLEPTEQRYQFFNAYTGPKFAQPDPAVGTFALWFEGHYGTRLDSLYSARMMFGLFDLLEQGNIPDSAVVVAVHTGAFFNDE